LEERGVILPGGGGCQRGWPCVWAEQKRTGFVCNDGLKQV
jgi:hypothetical protein